MEGSIENVPLQNDICSLHHLTQSPSLKSKPGSCKHSPPLTPHLVVTVYHILCNVRKMECIDFLGWALEVYF